MARTASCAVDGPFLDFCFARWRGTVCIPLSHDTGIIESTIIHGSGDQTSEILGKFGKLQI